MKCSVAAIFGAALVLGSSKQPSQSDNRNVASRDNPVPGAFQPNRIGTNKDAGGGVLGLSFESSISGGDSINGSNDNNKSTGEERAEEEASKDDNNSSFDKEKVAEAFADDSNNGNNLLHDFGHQNLSVQVSHVHRIQTDPLTCASHWFGDRVEKTRTRASLPGESTSSNCSI